MPGMRCHVSRYSRRRRRLPRAAAGATTRAPRSRRRPPPPRRPSRPPPAGRRAPSRLRSGTVVKGLTIPWELVFLPDGGALVTERPGRVRRLDSKLRLKREPVARVKVRAAGEGGLLGMALDPGFKRNRYLYLYRTTATGNEVVRYRFKSGKLTSPVTIVRGIKAGVVHDGGRLRFGPDERALHHHRRGGRRGPGPAARVAERQDPPRSRPPQRGGRPGDPLARPPQRAGTRLAAGVGAPLRHRVRPRRARRDQPDPRGHELRLAGLRRARTAPARRSSTIPR